MTGVRMADFGPRRLYLAFTPYHLLVCLAVQERDGFPPATVLFADEAGLADHAPGFVTGLAPYLEVVLRPRLEIGSTVTYPWRCRSLARGARRALVELQPVSEIFVANGVRPESFGVLRTARGAKVHYLEDGFDAYVACNRQDIARWHRSAHRLLCGHPHPSTRDMTEVAPYAAYHVVAPEIARTPRALTAPVPRSSLAFAAAVVADALPLTRPSQWITDLFTLGNTERLPDPARYLSRIADRIDRLRGEVPSAYVAVKAHPRERDVDFLDGLSQLCDFVVPHWAPAEVLCGSLDANVRIYTTAATFLITSRLLVPDRELHLEGGLEGAAREMFFRWDPQLVGTGG
ncbi:MAG TPA: hypothetical protein VMH41_08255 [Mycobacteriales bacterium]|nr:hypothetical protein [Mycobacteriales bacterium]